jgi:cytochrome c-type protein NapC
MDDAASQRGKGFWSSWWARPKTRWLLGVPAGGFAALLIGALAWGGVIEVLHVAGTNEFCYVCHSHQQFIRPEYEASGHFKNDKGVRAQCADCHLPRGDLRLLVTNLRVSINIIPELMGELDTAEKYEAARARLAETVWAQFRANDSEFCRHCHDFAAMDLEAQGSMARRRHASATERGQTCIDCHRGIVHALPKAQAPASESG